MTVPIKKFKFVFLYSAIAMILSLSIFFVFMLAGCGSSKTKVSILFHKSEVDGPFQELIKLYNKTHPNVKIEAQTSGGGGDYESVLQSKLGNNGVHIINYEGFGNMKKLENKLLDLSDMSIVKTLKASNPEILDCCVNGAQTLGFPVGIEGFGYMVNKPAFDQIGVDVLAIKNFDEFKSACERLQAAIPTKDFKAKFPNAESVFAVWGKDPWGLTNHIMHYIVGKDFKNSAEAYNSPTFPFSGADVYRNIIDFQTKLGVEGEPTKEKLANLITVDYSTSFDGRFLNQKSFVGQFGTWVIQAILEYDKANGTNLINSVEMLPWFVPGEQVPKYMLLGGQCWGINKDAPANVIEVCKDFLNWMYTSDEAKGRLYKDLKIVSPIISKEDLAKTKFDKITEKIVNAYLKGEYYVGGSIGLVRGEDWTLKNNGTAIQERLAGKINDVDFDKRITDGWEKKYKEQHQR